MLKRKLLLFLLVFFFGRCLLSAQSVSVSIEQIREWRNSAETLQQLIRESVKNQWLTNRALTELEKQYQKLEGQYLTLQITNNELMTALDEQNRKRKDYEIALTKSLSSKYIKITFAVGGVCIVVGGVIVGIIWYNVEKK